jgi:hypothetical protein
MMTRSTRELGHRIWDRSLTRVWQCLLLAAEQWK